MNFKMIVQYMQMLDAQLTSINCENMAVAI